MHRDEEGCHVRTFYLNLCHAPCFIPFNTRCMVGACQGLSRVWKSIQMVDSSASRSSREQRRRLDEPENIVEHCWNGCILIDLYKLFFFLSSFLFLFF